MQPDPDGHYARLGVAPTASAEAIGAAYRRRARVAHPDIPRTGSTEAFLALRAAYEVLSDPERRRAYDRAALPAPRAAVAPPQDPPPSDPPPPRPDRLGLWSGFLVLTAALAGFAMFRLAQGPTARLPDHPGKLPAPWTGPPVLPRAHPAGRPDHYVLPGLGLLNVLSPPTGGGQPRPVATLAPFTPVHVLGIDPARRLAAIGLAARQPGLVALDRLARGGADAAHAAFCADRAGPPPLSGERLVRLGVGHGRLTLVNQDLEPAVVKLRDASGRLVRVVFLGPGALVRLQRLPGRAWRVAFAVGELWSRPCGYFAAGERAQALRPMPRSGATLRLPLAAARDIPDRAFARP